MPATAAERFAAKVDTAGPISLRYGAPGRCYVWRASDDGKGYGKFWYTGRYVRAYRWIYIAAYGEIPAGLDIDHRCRNPRCVNPAHLEAVTHRINLLRSTNHVALRAAKTHCDSGHPFNAENTHRRTNGTRLCRTCARERARKARATSNPERTAA